jgi:hypothetical protein
VDWNRKKASYESGDFGLINCHNRTLLGEKRYDAVRGVCFMDTLDLGFVRTGWNHANPENIRNMYMEDYPKSA